MQIICIQCNKKWETLLAYLLQTKVLCKVAQIAATRSLNAQLFFVCHATYKAFFKTIPPIEITISWPFHWPASSLTLLINTLATGQSNWPMLGFLLLNWIAGIGIVFHCKHSLIHSYIQSLNPKLKILKFKYLQIRHKACWSPFLITNLPQRHNLFHENPLTPRSHDSLPCQRFHMRWRKETFEENANFWPKLWVNPFGKMVIFWLS